MPKKAAKSQSAMSSAHKEALAEGRRQGRIVRDYLEGIDARRAKRGRPRTPQSIEQRMSKIDESLQEASPVERLQLVQERLDLASELEALAAARNAEDVEAEFVDVAAAYSDRKGISYAAWREVGVPAAVLKQAGISRSS